MAVAVAAAQWAPIFRTIARWQKLAKGKPKIKGLMTSEMKLLLQKHDIEDLAPYLALMQVTTLGSLQGMKLMAFLSTLPEEENRELLSEKLSDESIQKFMQANVQYMQDTLFTTVRSGHFVFLSHYKGEAGTEVALMHSEMMTRANETPESPALDFDIPFFLDSDNLHDLNYLGEQVRSSHNLALLLTPGVFSRPWCLVDIVEATCSGVPIIPVQIIKA